MTTTLNVEPADQVLTEKYTINYQRHGDGEWHLSGLPKPYDYDSMEEAKAQIPSLVEKYPDVAFRIVRMTVTVVWGTS